jgi:glycosyltransferase involved in cell wall biosynthesis
MTPRLDIVIPVYNEGGNIVPTLAALAREVKTPSRVLICYDFPEDNTLPALERGRAQFPNLTVELVRNRSRGAHHAVMTGFAASTAPFVLMYPADHDYEAGIVDPMVKKAEEGCDIVCASRFMEGGSMTGCPPLKYFLTRAGNFTLYHLGRLPTHDASSGFRLFSRRVIDKIPVETETGFCYSIELLVKAHRLGWRIGEVPARWIERAQGQSRFRVLRWLPAYLRWYFYGFATTYLRRGPDSVTLRTKGV